MPDPHQQPKPFSTADVPSRFLKAAYLVGQVPHRVLASDPRVSYRMYIPPPPVYTSTPASPGARLPLLVSIHGTGRNIAAMHSELAMFADSVSCAVLAPLFPAGLDGPEDLDSYKLLRSATLRADLALLSIVDEVATRYPGIAAEKFYLMGFSGGGQFAHRFMYVHPERLAGVAPAAPGTVTLLGGDAKWPKGVADAEAMFGRPVDVKLLRTVPVKLFVGTDDVDLHGGEEFWVWLREMRSRSGTSKDKERGQGSEATATRKDSRRDGLNLLLEDWRSHGIECEIEVVAGAAHELGLVRGKMLQFIRTLMSKKTPLPAKAV